MLGGAKSNVPGVSAGVPDPNQLAAAAAAIATKSHARAAPRVGLVLGSGLGGLADGFVNRIPYAQIPGMPSMTVEGHGGELCLGTIADLPVACLVGRAHCYEGHPTASVVFGALLMRALGCECVLLTNAAGGINPEFQPGDLMLVEDHLNLTGRNPLVGPALPWGDRFPDMTEAYSPLLRTLAIEAAEQAGIPLRRGVYAGVLGPSYETPAEIRALGILGADAVGMSTVLEVIALHHAGVRVGAVSCITNLAAGLSSARLTHDDVRHTGEFAMPRFQKFVETWVDRIATELT